MPEELIPAIGLPNNLLNMLRGLCSDKANILTSWNLHDNIRSGLSVTIRFRHCEDSDSSVKPPMYFRRQSARQAERNKQRAMSHAAYASGVTPVIPNSHSQEDINTSKKRKIIDDSPETIRNHESISSLANSGVIDTPETVKVEYQVASLIQDTNIPIPNVFDTPGKFPENLNADMLDDSDSLSEILPSEAVDDTDSLSDMLPPPSPHHSGPSRHYADPDASLQSLEDSYENWTPEASVNTMKPMSHPPKISFLPPPSNVPQSSPSPPQSPTRPPDLLSTLALMEGLMRESLRRAIVKEAK